MTDVQRPPYICVQQLPEHQETPAKGTLSQTLYADEQAKIVLFTFAAGEELSEHTASMPAVMHFVRGSGQVTVAGDVIAAGPGTWVHMQPHCRHSVRAKEPLVMLLTLFKTAGK